MSTHPARMPSRRRLRVAAVALGVVVTLGLSACSSSGAGSVAAQAKAGDGKGYVGGDGTVEQLATGQRGQPVELSGTTVTGGTWTTAADGSGKVVVVNVWGTWCGPCIQEMPHLQSSWADYEKAKKDVVFVGIDTREGSALGASFLEANGITYPSINDQASGGQPMLALQGKATATPTTLVLDRQGRIAARVLGSTTEGTLTALVDDVLAEKA